MTSFQERCHPEERVIERRGISLHSFGLAAGLNLSKVSAYLLRIMARHATSARLLAMVFAAAAAGTAVAQEDSPDELYSKGLNSFNAGNYTVAAQAFGSLVERFGNERSLSNQFESVFYALGCSYYNLGTFPEAVRTLEEYLKRYPKARFTDEVMFRLGAAHQSTEAYDKAVVAYQRLVAESPSSPYAEDAAFQVGICFLAAEKPAKAAEAFAWFLQAYPESELAAQALVFRARALFDANQLAEAVDALEQAEKRGRRMEHVVYANFLALEIGDAAFDNTDYELALRAYRRVRTRESLLRLQGRLVEDLTAALQQAARPTAAVADVKARFRQERRIRTSLAQAKDLLKRLEDSPNYDDSLFHRIGRCFVSTDRLWEARTAFLRVVAEATDEKIREAAHFDLILVLSRMRQFDDLIVEADRYLTDYDTAETE